MDNIVKLDANNVGELGALNKELIADEGHGNSMSTPELVERMRVWLNGSYECYGVVRNNELVAYCLYRDDGDFFYIRQLFTARHVRNQGLASKLIDHLESNLLREKPIRLEVIVSNGQAKTFYENRGYQLYCHTMVKSS